MLHWEGNNEDVTDSELQSSNDLIKKECEQNLVTKDLPALNEVTRPESDLCLWASIFQETDCETNELISIKI